MNSWSELLNESQQEQLRTPANPNAGVQFLAELLLRMNRLEEAIEYANVVMEIAENHFYDTIEYAYACELYATALASNGELSDAENFYRSAKSRIKSEISDAERLLDCIDKNLECIEDFKDKHDSE